MAEGFARPAGSLEGGLQEKKSVREAFFGILVKTSCIKTDIRIKYDRLNCIDIPMRENVLRRVVFS